ncbi:Putative cytoplasmic protein [hydrothermal vent metagenome]|uniref:Putative cytoplasmic protein n=1 Tax=hydrothermal vent metagenome TaxID=652676 RepID=A0A1W1BY67_9ZZZZ
MLELTSAVNRLENFHKYMNEAYIYLKKHKEILDTHPMWYRLMLDISKGQKWDKKRFFSLLDEAILKYPYFEPIYYGALFHMHPKSASFSHAEIEIVAQKALKATKDKMNNSMYAKFYWVASQAIYKEKLFLDSNVKWEIMRKGIDDVLKDFPSQRNINYFAYYSCLAKDKNKTKELLSMIIKEPSKYPWIKNDNFYTKCVNWSK